MPNLKCYTREKSDGKKYVHCSSNPIKKGKKKRKTVKKPKLTVVDKIAGVGKPLYPKEGLVDGARKQFYEHYGSSISPKTQSLKSPLPKRVIRKPIRFRD